MNIKQRRLAKGWSQEELARHSGLSTRTIQRIESGQTAGIESLKCLAAVFETSLNALRLEQNTIKQKNALPFNQPKINKTEQAAITFAQSIFRGPDKDQTDPLWKCERGAVDHAKSLWSKFTTKVP